MTLYLFEAEVEKYTIFSIAMFDEGLHCTAGSTSL